MIVADSSPLIYLSRAGQIELLKDRYDEVWVSEGVVKEVIVEGKPGVTEIQKTLDQGWLRSEKAEVIFDPRSEWLEEVDAEILSLAQKKKTPLLTNDRALFYCAKTHGVECKWFTLVAVEAAGSGLLSPDEAEKLLTELIRMGLRVRSDVFAELLRWIRKT